MTQLRRFCILMLVLGALTVSGCVRSKGLVTSEPSGAEVSMNGVYLGETPVEYPFTWYWYYDFQARMDGYQTTDLRRRFYAPPWLWPGFDLLMEMMPFYVTDRKKVHLVLEPVDQRPAPILSES